MGSSAGHQKPPLICLCHKNIKQNTWLTCQKLMGIAGQSDGIILTYSTLCLGFVEEYIVILCLY